MMDNEITDEARLIYLILVDYEKPVQINRLAAATEMPKPWLERNLVPLIRLGLVNKDHETYSLEDADKVPVRGIERMARRVVEGQQHAPYTPPVRLRDLQVYRIVERKGKILEREVPALAKHSRFSLRTPIARLVAEGYIRRSVWATSGAVTLETPEVAIAREKRILAQALKTLAEYDAEVAQGIRYPSGRLRTRKRGHRASDHQGTQPSTGWMNEEKFTQWMRELAHADSPQPYGEPLGGL